MTRDYTWHTRDDKQSRCQTQTILTTVRSGRKLLSILVAYRLHGFGFVVKISSSRTQPSRKNARGTEMGFVVGHIHARTRRTFDSLAWQMRCRGNAARGRVALEVHRVGREAKMNKTKTSLLRLGSGCFDESLTDVKLHSVLHAQFSRDNSG